MLRARRGHAFDAWGTAVEQPGVKALRACAKGVRKEEAAVRAGRSLVWRNGPTAGVSHRFKRLQRQAYGRAGGACLRHRLLGPSAGAAASPAVRGAGEQTRAW